MVGHFVWVAEQVCWQTPPEQYLPAPQMADGVVAPQAPQFDGSVWKLVQKALGPIPQALGVLMGQLHFPLEQVWPASQVL